MVWDGVRFLEFWGRRRFSRFEKVGLNMHEAPQHLNDARRMAWYEIERFSEGVEFHVDTICVHVDFAECLKVGLKSLL